MPNRYLRPRPLRYPVASVHGIGGPWRFRGELLARTIRFVDSEPFLVIIFIESPIQFILSIYNYHMLFACSPLNPRSGILSCVV